MRLQSPGDASPLVIERSGHVPRPVFVLLVFVASVATVATGTHLIRSGSGWVFVIPIIISPVMMIVVRLLLEPGFPLFEGKQSLAYLIGDSVALPFALWAAAMSWRTIGREDGFHQQWWWLVVAIAVGALITYGWRTYLDAPNYVRAGAADRLNVATKLWHDFMVYPALATLLVWGGIPAMFKDFSGYGRWVLTGGVLWGCLGIWDGFRGLDPRFMHPREQDTLLR